MLRLIAQESNHLRLKTFYVYSCDVDNGDASYFWKSVPNKTPKLLQTWSNPRQQFKVFVHRVSRFYKSKKVTNMKGLSKQSYITKRPKIEKISPSKPIQLSEHINTQHPLCTFHSPHFFSFSSWEARNINTVSP